MTPTVTLTAPDGTATDLTVADDGIGEDGIRSWLASTAEWLDPRATLTVDDLDGDARVLVITPLLVTTYTTATAPTPLPTQEEP